MGFFDFVKNAGRKIGLLDDKPDPNDATAVIDANKARGRKLTAELASLRLPAEGLDVRFANGIAQLRGSGDLEVRDKLVVALGNVEGVERVDDQFKVVYPSTPVDREAPAEDAPAPVFHTVEKGDTLSAIAKKVYGSAAMYPIIFQANRPMLGDPNEIYPGQVLRIPDRPGDVKHTVKSGDTLGKIAKQYLGDAGRYKEIFAANTDILDDPNKIAVGQILVIPVKPAVA